MGKVGQMLALWFQLSDKEKLEFIDAVNRPRTDLNKSIYKGAGVSIQNINDIGSKTNRTINTKPLK